MNRVKRQAVCAEALPGHSAPYMCISERLSETVSWEPETKPPTNDMAILDEEDGITPLPSKFDPRLQRLARQAALDPDDGIAL